MEGRLAWVCGEYSEWGAIEKTPGLIFDRIPWGKSCERCDQILQTFQKVPSGAGNGCVHFRGA